MPEARQPIKPDGPAARCRRCGRFISGGSEQGCPFKKERMLILRTAASNEPVTDDVKAAIRSALARCRPDDDHGRHCEVLVRGYTGRDTDLMGGAICWSAGRNSTGVIEALLRGGHSPNATCSLNRGWTAAHEAARKDHEAAIEVLSDRGADLNAYAYCIHGTPMHVAALFSRVRSIRVLAGLGGDVNARRQDTQMDTPLHVTARRGQFAAFTALLELGADPQLANAAGETPMALALGSPHADIRDVMHAHRARHDLTDVVDALLPGKDNGNE